MLQILSGGGSGHFKQGNITIPKSGILQVIVGQGGRGEEQLREMIAPQVMVIRAGEPGTTGEATEVFGEEGDEENRVKALGGNPGKGRQGGAGWSGGGSAGGRGGTTGSDGESGPPALWVVREDEAEHCPDGEGYGGGGGGGVRSGHPGIAIIYCSEEKNV